MLLGALITLIACEEPKEIGLAPTTPVGVYYTDTLTINRSTLLLDSVRSNRQSALLIGRYTDPVFGKVSSSAYAQLFLTQQFVIQDANKVDVPAANLIYDSTRLVLNYEYIYGDTAQLQEIVAYPLIDSINTTAHYDIISPAPRYATQPIVKQQFLPLPGTSTRLFFKVDDGYGRKLLSLANTDAAKDNGLLRAKFPGVAIATTSSDKAALLGFVAGTSLIAVYYHTTTDSTARGQGFYFSGGRFNKIAANRMGTPFAQLVPQKPLPSTATADQTFAQPATGVTTKLDFPTLKNLAANNRVAINRADLVITIKQPDNLQFYAPIYLTLGEVDEQNHLRRTTIAGYPQLLPTYLLDRTAGSFSNPQVVSISTRTYTYSFSMGGYLQSILSGLSPNTGLILLAPGNPALFSNGADQTQFLLNNRVWRMILDGKASAKLQVFYTYSS